MTHVILDQLHKQYAGASEAAVCDFSLDVPAGQLVALLGPSGSGKTTTLKMIGGLIRPTAGKITFDGEDVVSVPAEKRGAVMVFQNHLLFPYMSVGENVGFGLKMRGVDRRTIQQRVNEMLALVKLPDIAKRRPQHLSGGQQQRVALARALITEPRVLLLDEPLSNLDAHLRDEMRDLILSVQRDFGITTLFVTHDQEEAVLLADRIALMFEGVLQQYAPPVEFYARPTSERAARFFGGVNFLLATRHVDHAETPLGRLHLNTARCTSAPTGAVLLTIRPEQVQLGMGRDLPNSFAGRVLDRIYVGTYTRYKIRLGDTTIEAWRSADLPGQLAAGDEITVHLPPDHLWVMPRS